MVKGTNENRRHPETRKTMDTHLRGGGNGGGGGRNGTDRRRNGFVELLRKRLVRIETKRDPSRKRQRK